VEPVHVGARPGEMLGGLARAQQVRGVPHRAPRQQRPGAGTAPRCSRRNPVGLASSAPRGWAPARAAPTTSVICPVILAPVAMKYVLLLSERQRSLEEGAKRPSRRVAATRLVPIFETRCGPLLRMRRVRSAGTRRAMNSAATTRKAISAVC
jgi:hypothetical protein